MELAGRRIVVQPKPAEPPPKLRTLTKSGSVIFHKQDRSNWTSWRLKVAAVVEDQWFDTGMGLVVFFNGLLLVIDTNANAECSELSCTETWITVMNALLMCLYITEVGLRMFIDRNVYFCSSWNLLDFFVVSFAIFDFGISLSVESAKMPDVQVLKLFRLLRLVRLVRCLGLFPALQAIVRGFGHALQAMFWGVVTIMLLLCVFGIVAVEVVHPRNKALTEDTPDWCVEAFSSVQHAVLFFFQTALLGDSWGHCTVGLMTNHWWLFLFFGTVVVIIQLGLMNLILTAIVDEAQRAHDMDKEAALMKIEESELRSMTELSEVFADIDQDKSGNVDYDEIIQAYENNADFQRLMKILGLEQNSMKELFKLMDTDKSGTIDYEEFIEVMRTSHATDIRAQAMVMKLRMESLAEETQHAFETLSSQIKYVSAKMGFVAMQAPPATVICGTKSAKSQKSATSPKSATSTEKERFGLASCEGEEVWQPEGVKVEQTRTAMAMPTSAVKGRDILGEDLSLALDAEILRLQESIDSHVSALSKAGDAISRRLISDISAKLTAQHLQDHAGGRTTNNSKLGDLWQSAASHFSNETSGGQSNFAGEGRGSQGLQVPRSGLFQGDVDLDVLCASQQADRANVPHMTCHRNFPA